jgi:putative hydrolase of the HAD superfamily
MSAGARNQAPGAARASTRQSYRETVTELEAVLFDVDFTLVHPGPELGPEGYRRLGERHGLALAPELYDVARAAAITSLKRDPEFRHDDEIWIAFTEQIVRGMGGDAEGARACAEEMTAAWELHYNFELYEDALPVLEELRRYELKLGLVSNTGRDLEAFVLHHRIDVDVAIGSRAHGRTKPDPTIFRAALEQLGVEPGRATMVGDSVEDDVEGAAAIGMRAILLDRDGRYPEFAPRLDDLYGLPAALGLPRA